MRFNDVYNPQTLKKNLLLFVAALIIMKVTGGSGFALLAPFILIAITQNKTERLLVYMMVMICMLVGNGILMPKNSIFSLTQKMLVVLMSFLMMSRLGGSRQSPIVKPFMGMMAYIGFMALSSIQGWNPLISFLKLFLFSTCFLAYYSMANTVITDRRIDIRNIRSAYLAAASFMLIGSVLLLRFPGIANMRGEAYLEALANGQELTSLFCGMTFHSQALGPLVAMLFVLILGDMLFAVRRPDKLMVVLLLCCPILIYKTSSRTAMGTMLVGASFLMWQFMQARRMSSRWRGKVVSTSLLLVIFASIALLVTGSGRNAVTKYVLKQTSVDSGITMENVMVTRQGLMDSAMENFREKPLFGNGFQVSQDLIGAGKSGLASILSAPVEKGVWVTAVLEEGGAVGFLIFVGFIISAILTLRRRHAYISSAMLLTIAVLNMGEFTMFSMSGIGGFYWCLCFVGVIMDAQRLKFDQMPMYRPMGAMW